MRVALEDGEVGGELRSGVGRMEIAVFTDGKSFVTSCAIVVVFPGCSGDIVMLRLTLTAFRWFWGQFRPLEGLCGIVVEVWTVIGRGDAVCT